MSTLAAFLPVLGLVCLTAFVLFFGWLDCLAWLKRNKPGVEIPRSIEELLEARQSERSAASG